MVAERTVLGTELSGAEVVFTGRLASMPRDEAEERVARAGGRVVEAPGPATRFLVVGEDGPPLGEDGHLTRSLREARKRREGGQELAILGEEDFLRLIDQDERCAGLQRLYTTQQLARILDVPSAELRRWIRLGLVRPLQVVRRLHFFDFRQVATARRLAQLTRAGVSVARLRKSLEELSLWSGDASRALAQLQALEGGGALALRTDAGLLAEPSGQLRLAFEPEPLLPAPPAREAQPEGDGSDEAGWAPDRESPRRRRAAGELTWFERAVLLEEHGRFDDAIQAYRNAVLEDDDARPEALFNLGNVLYAVERFDEAARFLARATEVDPEFVEAWNNLGNALGRAGRTSEAVAAFARALSIEPHYADAHFNLAETLAAAGDVGGARHHWRAYLAEDPVSPWADVVRERLTLKL